MACIVIVTTTKPSDKVWNHHTLANQHDHYRIWLERFPGFINKSGREIDPNTWENTFVFDSRESWNRFIAEKADLSWWKDIVKYNAENGISSTTTFID